MSRKFQHVWENKLIDKIAEKRLLSWNQQLRWRLKITEDRIWYLERLGFTQRRRLNRQRKITVKEELHKLRQYIIINKLGNDHVG